MYSAFSVGDPLGALTFGAALPFSGDADLEDFVALLFGGEKQLSNNVKLLTENWLLLGDDNENLLLFSAGIRFIGDRLTVGLGFFTFEEFIDEGEGFPVIPWLDFSLSFGK